MTERLLTDEELRHIDAYLEKRLVLGHEFAASIDAQRAIVDLRRYRAWCRRLVKCYDGEGDVIALAKEVRAALEDKPC